MIISAGKMIIGDGKRVIADGSAVVRGRKIIAVGKSEDIRSRFTGEDETIYKTGTLLPGLIDAHVHLGYYYSQLDTYRYDNYLIAYYAAHQAQMALERGITTVRDLASPNGLCRSLSLAGEKGFLKVPRIINAGPAMCCTGGHAHMDGVEEVDGADQIRKTVRKQLKDGADWIKMMATNRDDTPEFTQAELNACVDECHMRHVKCAVHAGTQPGIQMSIDAGFDTIEHGTFLTEAQALQMKAHHQAWTPTMFAYVFLDNYCTQSRPSFGGATSPTEAFYLKHHAFYRQSAMAYRQHFKKLYDTGVTVLAGSDMVMREAPALPLKEELKLMVKFGLTPVEALATATGNPACILGLGDWIGTIEKGKTADLLVVDGDAAGDIKALDNVRAVYLDGERLTFGPELNVSEYMVPHAQFNAVHG